MLEYIGSLVKRERPDFISDMRTTQSGTLTAVTIKYAKGGRYYVATTYFTDSWVSATPYPKQGVVVRKLSDVCDIKEFPSKSLMEAYPSVSKADLSDFNSQLQMAVTRSLQNLFAGNEYGDTTRVNVQLSPVLSVLVSVWNGASFVGSMLVFPDGDAKVAFAIEERMYKYAASYRQQQYAVPQLALEGDAV